ncbi:MAG TPA: choice-of-anchor A family protein, partial [Acidimicrobiales bacterium]|nr:choice-of-anchor A family protein [Acidimicrobiales bacterium]
MALVGAGYIRLTPARHAWHTWAITCAVPTSRRKGGRSAPRTTASVLEPELTLIAVYTPRIVVESGPNISCSRFEAYLRQVKGLKGTDQVFRRLAGVMTEGSFQEKALSRTFGLSTRGAWVKRTITSLPRRVLAGAASAVTISGVVLLGVAMVSAGNEALASGVLPTAPDASALAGYVGGYSEYSTCVGITGTCVTRGQPTSVDSNGAVAVDGNLSADHFYVGANLSNSQALAVAGNVSGTLTISNTAGGNTGVYGGTSTATSPNGGPVTGLSYEGAAAFSGFAGIDSELQTLSSGWAGYSANGNVSTGVLDTLYLTGTASDLDVFNLSASQVAATTNLYINVPVGAHTLINVSGTALDCSTAACLQNVWYWNGSAYEAGAQYNSSAVEQLHAATLLNLPDATRVNLAAAGPAINILAPQADFTFDNGMLFGFVYARSVNGTFE